MKFLALALIAFSQLALADVAVEDESPINLCFSDSQCMFTQHCAIGGSGAGECVDNPVVGECRQDSDCSWPKHCYAWYCH